MNQNEWQTIHYYQSCLEAAERCGFTIDQDRDLRVTIVAHNHPYVDGTVIKVANGFYAALCWLQGYEQRVFEVKNT